jgi:hypothetical protein
MLEVSGVAGQQTVGLAVNRRIESADPWFEPDDLRQFPGFRVVPDAVKL